MKWNKQKIVFTKKYSQNDGNRDQLNFSRSSAVYVIHRNKIVTHNITYKSWFKAKLCVIFSLGLINDCIIFINS